VLDATCVDTYAESHVNNSAVTSEEAAKSAEERKRSKYATLGTRYTFEPIALETTGVYGTTTGTLLSEIGRSVTQVTGDPRETLWLEQRIGLAVQRGNAYSILTWVKRRYDETRHSSQLEPRRRQVDDGHHHERSPCTRPVF